MVGRGTVNIKAIEKLPSKEKLLSILKKTIEKSWKIDMDVGDIESWLDNFKGELFDSHDEQQLALWLLCNFTFYNEDDVRHLCKSLYNIFYHQILMDFSINTEKELADILSKVKFSAIGSASQSGSYLLYNFRHEAELSIKKFFYPTSLVPNSDTIVAFIDDVMLSGGSAVEFFENNLKDFKAKKIYYISFFVTEDAIKKLENIGIRVVYCSLLTERNKCFSPNSMIFSKYTDLLDVTQKLAEHYGTKVMSTNPLGHDDGQFCFGFYYNTPNNTLPIFWSNSKGWQPIFERRGKKVKNGKHKKYI